MESITIEHDKEREKELASNSDNVATKKQERTGELEVSDYYIFERFNKNDEYSEVRNDFFNDRTEEITNKGLTWATKFAGGSFIDAKIKNRREHVFENKKDGTKISIRESKIIFDNTAQNYQAALDIAQDKGWTTIKIHGRNKSASAELWFLAQMRGLETKGYEPTSADMKRLEGAKRREEQNNEAGIDIKPKQMQNETKGFSEQELLTQQIKSIVAEASQLADLDDKQTHILEETIMQGIATAQTQGKRVDMKNLFENSEKIKNSLPEVREKFEKSVNMEQKISKNRTQQNGERNKSPKNPPEITR